MRSRLASMSKIPPQLIELFFADIETFLLFAKHVFLPGCEFKRAIIPIVPRVNKGGNHFIAVWRRGPEFPESLISIVTKPWRLHGSFGHPFFSQED